MRGQVRHGIEHGSRKAVYNYAVFGGSNGFWRSEVLQMIGMDPNMLTEDIDSSIRAMSYGSVTCCAACAYDCISFAVCGRYGRVGTHAVLAYFLPTKGLPRMGA